MKARKFLLLIRMLAPLHGFRDRALCAFRRGCADASHGGLSLGIRCVSACDDRGARNLRMANPAEEVRGCETIWS